MYMILKSAAVAIGALAFAGAALAQEGAPPPRPAQGAQPGQQGTAPPQGPPRRAPQPYKPSSAVVASFGDRNANFTGVVDADQGQLCYLLNVAGMGGATAAKIVSGQPDKPGAVAVNLQAPADGSSGTCATIGNTAKALLDHPENYFVEVDHPQGAAVAQLHSETYG